MRDERVKPISVNGILVDPVLLETRELRRCTIDDCDAMCCTGGVYVFSHEVSDLRAHRDTLLPHMPVTRRNPERWFDGEVVPEIDHPDGGTAEGTTVAPDSTHPYGQACVFLRPDRGCALQVAGVAAGEHPWRYKPLWCALHPLEFENGVLTLAEDNAVYQRGGSCSRPAPGSPIPLFRLFEVETRLALGDAGFEELSRIASVELP